MSNIAGSKWIRANKRQSLYFRDGFACVYCGETESLSLDHLQPRELGGSHATENLVTACVPCNSARRDLPLREWLQVLRDRGIDTKGMALKIRRLTAKPLDMAMGHKLLAARRGR